MMFKFIFSAILSMALISCSDQKDQVKQGVGVPNPSPNTIAQPGGVSPSEVDDRTIIPGNIADRDPNTGFDPRLGLDNERDDLTEQNSKQPILFNGLNPSDSGAAGISFQTTRDEARDLLSDPVEYACGFYYEEGLCVDWKKDGSQKPNGIIIINSYLGEIELPAPIGKIRMGAELNKYFTPNDPVGANIVDQLYRYFFKVTDNNYSCIADGKCEARAIEEVIIWRLPNIFFQMSKEGDKELVLIFLENKLDSGILNADFDLLENKFSNQDAEVYLGQTWGEVKTIGGVQEVESTILTTNFKKDYDGVNAYVYRPDAFLNQQMDSFAAPQEAEDSDVFNTVSLFGNYGGSILIGGEYVKLDTQGNIKLSSDKTESSDEFLLKTQIPALADKFEVQVKILNNLEKLILSKLKSKFGKDLKYSIRYDGLESRPKSNKWINFTVNYFADLSNLSTNLSPTILRDTFKTTNDFEAGYLFVGVSVKNGYFQILKEVSSDPFSQIVSESFVKSINLNDKVKATVTKVEDGNSTEKLVDVATLGGFTIGEKVTLTDIDWLRSEATFSAKGKSIRVSFKSRDFIRVSDFPGRTEARSLWTVSGVGRLSFGLTPITKSPRSAKTIEAKLSTITSFLNPIGIRGLCGFDNLVVRDSSYQSVREVMVTELKATKSQCGFFGRGNVAADGEYSEMYFPEQKTKIIFNDKQFTGVTIYE